jgi:YggT family protein
MTGILIGRLFIAAATILHYILYFYGIVVLAAIVISWIRPDPYNPTVAGIMRVVHKLTEPVFYQIRKRLPAALNNTGLDFSPMIIGLAIMVLETLLVGTLFDIGYRLRIGAF